ncbi:16S rRNA (cytidine(1402)-2'-O)-methyltransferase [Pleionea mediterranea]|uniref:Ribosomal RNA small subunit methyltransferase I n=1 Tax=Pleionea mediterranea TaxID=523701 RepID=A0A316FIK9_9GAMM|nr:16S rRNA (cytidine(1402)-2'-O)-methyltransferase [Pleionea mediterranea]PWK47945.1 16S rRNA (cytidine1402-2'-O)-methyltransferase [Pleionea mediterranea]
MASQLGTLYVVATPIGNLDDLSKRAIDTLKQVQRILAEDTRRSQQLLTNFSIRGSLTSLHDHNERQRVEQVKAWLAQGDDLALISDAGTPLISDPGYVLVNQLRQDGFNVVPIPGPCAIITALSVAGLPTDRFCFEGFLPAKPSGRRKVLQAMSEESRTWVFYESSHRVLECLKDMNQVLGAERELVLARELTKRFETVISGTCEAVMAVLSSDSNQCRGEFVIMVKGLPEVTSAPPVSPELLLQELLPHVSTKTASQIAAKLTGLPKKELYQMALGLKP